MWTVNLSLLPAWAWAFFIFGWGAFGVTLASILGALAGEELVSRLRKQKSTLQDGAAFCTGLLLGFTLPPAMPIWMPLLGAALGIILSKGLFGGLGYNLFNPALVGRALMMATFPVMMTTKWIVPQLGKFFSPDAVATATPLAVLKEKGPEAAFQLLQNLPGDSHYLWNLILGFRPGSIGEVSVVFILLGAAFLMWKKIIKIWIPLSVLVGLAVMAYFSQAPLLHFFSGGVWLGAFYMATDYVTSPNTIRGQIIFGLGIGILTGVIRLWGGYPEGVNYAILLMNIVTPALNEWFRPERISLRGAP
jgi:electron transport complex protein RnfD